MKTISSAKRAQLFPIDLNTGKISGEPIDVTPKVARKPISYGKVKYKVEWAK